jgi:hypothetical protein
VLRAAGETETTQENIQDWLKLAEGNSEFQVVFLFTFISTAYIIKFLICFLIFKYLFHFFNPDDPLQVIWISEGFL